MNNLIVPINVQALCIGINDKYDFLKKEADFSDIPCKGQSIEPYLSNKILSKPFDSDKISMATGIHLHWSLPDALTKGIVDEKNDLAFPDVPNTWLITRIYPDPADPDKTITKSWIIEADYLSEHENNNNTTIPYKSEKSDKSDKKPYRYIGKVFDCDE